MAKNIFILILGLIVGFGGGVIFQSHHPDLSPLTQQTSTTTPSQDTTEEESGDNATICIQVITPARNPQTGEIKEFPTPCDIPAGWEKIQNEEPTL